MGLCVTARFQKGGRGLGVNRWESARGKNLLFSTRFAPKRLHVRYGFYVAMCSALALIKTLQEFIAPEERKYLKIKWPNDIYYKDMKLSGTLVETAMVGKQIMEVVVGVGLNVNQVAFESDAPNPISLQMIMGKSYHKKYILQTYLDRFSEYIRLLNRLEYDLIYSEYYTYLYHTDAYYMWQDMNGVFEAMIQRVEGDGRLALIGKDGKVRRYEFKEVQHVV